MPCSVDQRSRSWTVFWPMPAGRQIDHALQADGVERVVNQTQVRQHVFDFATLVEAHAAHQR